MDVISYGAFSESFQSRLSSRRVPLNGTIEVTRRCSLTCLHCYNNLPMNDSEAQGRELDYAEHCRLLDELADVAHDTPSRTASKRSRREWSIPLAPRGGDRPRAGRARRRP